MSKKNAVSAKTAKLLRRVKEHVLAVPKRLDMDVFIDRKAEGGIASYPQCGTVGCIAGWTVTLSTKEPVPYMEIETRAAKLLGISEYQAVGLFYVPDWPYKFERRISRTKAQGAAHARVVADRIEHFIKTGE